MIEEATPFVVGHDEQTAFPVGGLRERPEHVGEETLTGDRIGEWMIIGLPPWCVRRIDVGDRGQTPSGAVLEVTVDRRDDGDHAGSVQSQ